MVASSHAPRPPAPGARPVAIVFGADYPLGAAAAIALAANGWSVLVVGSDEHALGQIVGQIAFGGGRARLLVDAGLHDVEAAIARAAVAFGAGEPRQVFGPGWEPPAGSPLDAFVLRPSASLAEASAQAREAAGAPFGRVFVAPGGDDPTRLAPVLAGPPGVRVLPAGVDA
ncbi:MAG TPA: hypothetical protein VLM85_04560 [Polyangiaceae bacterium]|nr:hypothetical protein [Polyangiaceae bacterium]